MPKPYSIGHVLKTSCKRGEIHYQPDMDPTTPWVLYWDGQAKLAFESDEAAAKWLKDVKQTTLEME